MTNTLAKLHSIKWHPRATRNSSNSEATSQALGRLRHTQWLTPKWARRISQATKSQGIAVGTGWCERCRD